MRWSLALAALDAVMSPDWDLRYFDAGLGAQPDLGGADLLFGLLDGSPQTYTELAAGHYKVELPSPVVKRFFAHAPATAADVRALTSDAVPMAFCVSWHRSASPVHRAYSPRCRPASGYGAQVLREIWPFLVAKGAAGHEVTVARLVDRVGPGSRPVGAMMAVASDGSWCGSISGGCVEGLLLAQAEEVLNGAAPRVAVVRPGEDRMPWEVSGACTGELHVLVTRAPGGEVSAAINRAMMENRRVRVRTSLTDPYAWAVGPASGPGQEREFVEDVEPQPLLLIVGATDLAMALGEIAAAVGRRVVVVDPRSDFAKAERVPAALVVQAWPDEWLRENPLTPRDAALVVTHDLKIDDQALEALLPGAAGYVGVLGSRATQAERVARLSHVVGVERLAGPAGLDLGGRSTAETALSMVAEVVASAHGRSGGRLRDGAGPVQEQ